MLSHCVVDVNDVIVSFCSSASHSQRRGDRGVNWGFTVKEAQLQCCCICERVMRIHSVGEKVISSC